MSRNSPSIAAIRATGGGGDGGTVSTSLRDWIRGIAPQIKAFIAGSAAGAEPEGIAIRLVGMVPRVVPLSPGRRSAALALDYLITAHLADPIAEHAAISEIAFAALDSSDFVLLPDCPVADLCASFAIPAAPGLVLRTELRRDVRLPQAPLVREPPVPQVEPLVQAHGRVVGPGNVPIPGALVTIAGSSSSTTGPDGRFRFAIPAGQSATVTARARSREATASLTPETETILTLQMEA